MFNYPVERVTNVIQNAHSDFIRTVHPLAASDEVLVSGGLDKLVKIFDLREDKEPKTIFEVGDEVEDLVVYSEDTKMVTVGGKIVKKPIFLTKRRGGGI